MKNTNELNMTFKQTVPVTHLQQNFLVLEINIIFRSINNVITSSDANNKILFNGGDDRQISEKESLW